MLPGKMGHHNEVEHWQEFASLETDGKKQLSSKVSGSQKQDHPANLCDNLFMVFVMRDVEDEAKE
jgi:hypothetical protein